MPRSSTVAKLGTYGRRRWIHTSGILPQQIIVRRNFVISPRVGMGDISQPPMIRWLRMSLLALLVSTLGYDQHMKDEDIQSRARKEVKPC